MVKNTRLSVSYHNNLDVCIICAYICFMNDHFETAQQGPVVQPPPGKTRITIRLDTDILNWFKKQVHEAGGGNYQTLVNQALREHIQANNGALEQTLRKVIREELGSYSV